MTARTKLIGVAGIAVLLTAALFTIFNKKWWIHRITSKWQVAILPNAKDDSPWTVTGNDLTKFSLWELMSAWSKGQPGWTPQGTELPPPDTTSEFDVQ